MNDFYQTLLGEMPTGAFWAYFSMAIIGMLVSWFTQLGDNHNNIKDSGGFKASTWIMDNWPRLVWNPLVIIIGIISFKEIYGKDITPLSAGFLGLSCDVLVDRFKGMIAIARGKK